MKQEEKTEQLDGDAGVQKLFKDIYGGEYRPQSTAICAHTGHSMHLLRDASPTRMFEVVAAFRLHRVLSLRSRPQDGINGRAVLGVCRC